jgi:CBS domain-containing protein
MSGRKDLVGCPFDAQACITAAPHQSGSAVPGGRGGDMSNVAVTVPTVANLMTRSPVIVRDDEPVASVAGFLSNHGIAGLPVVDERGRLIGVISATDLVRARVSILRGTGWLGLLVRDIMTSPARTIAASAPFEEAARLMTEHRVHRLVVVDRRDRPIGVLSQSDIVREMADER